MTANARPTNHYLRLAQAHAVRQFGDAAIRAHDEAIAIHGPDPQCDIIAIAGLLFAIEVIERHYPPYFRRALVRELES